MSYPDVESVSSSNNRLITEELDYDVPMIKNDYDRMFLALTDEQRNIFLNIMSAIQENKGGVFFVYSYGGTGKTFLWKTISAAIRSEGNIVLNVASSGIASLLLPGGRTAHSRFIISFELTEDSFCNINPDGELASLIRKTSLIIWDEAPMIHKHAFEALDRTFKDLLRCVNSTISNIPFGGKVIVFGGDFRQILPVVPGGSRQNIVNASLSSSYLWEHCKVHRLTKNMRLTVGRDQSDIGKIRDFANWLLDIGEGKLGGPNDGETIIDIPDDILINDSHDPIVVQEINDRLLKKFPGDEVEYFSSDSICESEFLHDQFDANLYSPDVLNGLKVSGLPNHKLVLKIGVPVMLLRNIDQKNGLCNGTRLQVLSLGKRVIEARIITGTNIGNRTFIPRMSLTPSEKKIPFKFTRRQFPLAVCFAMTINKSQGQSLSNVGLFLKDPVFSHEQLYVALSRVQSREGLKLLILDKDDKLTNKTSNVVYKEVFRNL
ncbi:ATP-dependent DNA helicase PIF1-like [Lactuca sativa]|uniref:ATP-dependent DNA helicase PIF1-like n=1 Tax=Lactuca sativa TaxID=4236 RepID=UPI0022AF5DCB|nr:ATP-dependent DNA helicase PIF1-like [Lactuca sativa]